MIGCDVDLRAALAEAEAEIARHHRDFQLISDICDLAFRDPSGDFEFYLRRVRNVVG